MYSWYLKISNSLNDIPENGKYKRSIEKQMDSDYSFFREMLEDFKTTDDWVSFVIEFIPCK